MTSLSGLIPKKFKESPRRTTQKSNQTALTIEALERRQMMAADSPFTASQFMDALGSGSNNGCSESAWTQTYNVQGNLGLDTGLLTSNVVSVNATAGSGMTNSRSDQFVSSTRVPISAVSSGTVTSSIDVAGLNGMITDVDVTLDITHTWNADLILTLVSPAGTRVELFRKIGGASDNFNDTTLDDEASTPIGQGSAPFRGVFRPRGSLASLDGEDPNGTWTLEVTDTFLLDGGSLNRWTLDLDTEYASNTAREFTNDSPLSIDPVVPGTVISTIDVSSLSGNITDVDVTLDITHTWNSDLTVTLVSPAGSRVQLFGGIGGSSDNFRDTTLDDEAVTPVRQGLAPFSGDFRPQESLGGLDGESPNGLWTLEVTDAFFLDGGSLNSWTLSVATVQASGGSGGTGGGGQPPVSDFTIDVRFIDSTLSPSQQQVFQDAADRWAEIIVGDIPDVVTDIGLVDDIVIDASAPSIDGPGRILGQAGPTLVRSGSLLPARGMMQFDAADLAALELSGQLVDVILHEMGHVLGIGTLWSALNLVQDAGTANPVFVGASAMTEYANIAGLTGPTPVPVANTGGGGTRDAHWRESVFDNELLTGFLNGGQANPISRFTIGSLEDIGYDVNYAAADPYGLPSVAAVQATNDVDHNHDDGAHDHGFGTLLDVVFAVLPEMSLTPASVKSIATFASALADAAATGGSMRDEDATQFDSCGALSEALEEPEDESIRVVPLAENSAVNVSALELVAVADPVDYTCLANEIFGDDGLFAS